MNEIGAFFLGVIQGLTEFLPVSSSGHLELYKAFFTSQAQAEAGLMFTIVLHGATALSTVVVFRKDIYSLLKELFQFELNSSFYFCLYILISMIPAAFIGIFYKEILERLFNQNLLLVGASLLITGGLLFLADRAKTSEKSIDITSASVIGIVQAIAILPGISRSGITIATAVLLGIDKEKAARFSFLMVIPLIFGSMGKSLIDVNFSSTDLAILPLCIGFITACITGIIACRWMIAIVKKAKLRYFSIYCFAVGTATLMSFFL